MQTGVQKNGKKTSGGNDTGHETMYLRSLVQRQVRVVIKLSDGEQLRGVIEYFDHNMVRLTRQTKPNLFLYKHHIHTICEEPRKRVSGNGAHLPA